MKSGISVIQSSTKYIDHTFREILCHSVVNFFSVVHPCLPRRSPEGEGGSSVLCKVSTG